MKVEELIDQYGDDILRLCTAYLGNRELAEDAFQETFLKAWRTAERFRGACSEKTWLCTIAVNTCRDLLRSKWFRMWRKSESIDVLTEWEAPCPEEAVPIRTAVLSLPRIYREIILLYYDQDMNLRQIADVLHLSPNTISSRLRRARKQLAKMLKGEIAP